MQKIMLVHFQRPFNPVAKAPRIYAIADPNLFRPISLMSVVCKVLDLFAK